MNFNIDMLGREIFVLEEKCYEHKPSPMLVGENIPMPRVFNMHVDRSRQVIRKYIDVWDIVLNKYMFL